MKNYYPISNLVKQSFSLIDEIDAKDKTNEEDYTNILIFKIISSIPSDQKAEDLTTEKIHDLISNYFQRIEYLELDTQDSKSKFFSGFIKQMAKDLVIMPDLVNSGVWYTKDIYFKQVVENIGIGNNNLTYWGSNISDSSDYIELTTLELVEVIFIIHENISTYKKVDSKAKLHSILEEVLKLNIKNLSLSQSNIEKTKNILDNPVNIDISNLQEIQNNNLNSLKKGMKILEEFRSNGICISDIKDESLEKSGPVPKGYDEKFSFSIAEVYPRGGQIFICSNRSDASEIYEYYYQLRILAGPYLFRSQCGKMIAQLNSGLTQETGYLFENLISNIIIAE